MAMEPDLQPERSQRNSLIGWGLVLALLVVAGVGFVRIVTSKEHSISLVSQIADGKRPAAPVLPTAALGGGTTRGIPVLGGHAPGNVTIVNFWASWCGPCQAEAKTFATLGRQYAGKGVTFVGVDAQDAASDAQAFVRHYGISYPIVHASDDQKNAWGVSGFPETFVIGRDGKVTNHVSGQVDQDELTDAIDAELKRPA